MGYGTLYRYLIDLSCPATKESVTVDGRSQQHTVSFNYVDQVIGRRSVK